MSVPGGDAWQLSVALGPEWGLGVGWGWGLSSGVRWEPGEQVAPGRWHLIRTEGRRRRAPPLPVWPEAPAQSALHLKAETKQSNTKRPALPVPAGSPSAFQHSRIIGTPALGLCHQGHPGRPLWWPVLSLTLVWTFARQNCDVGDAYFSVPRPCELNII